LIGESDRRGNLAADARQDGLAIARHRGIPHAIIAAPARPAGPGFFLQATLPERISQITETRMRDPLSA